jgi:hypothetical protein
MKAIQLHDKHTEEIIGTVLLKGNTDFAQICNAWDEYQKYNNSNLDNEADIYEFVGQNENLCEVLEIDFYQP